MGEDDDLGVDEEAVTGPGGSGRHDGHGGPAGPDGPDGSGRSGRRDGGDDDGGSGASTAEEEGAPDPTAEGVAHLQAAAREVIAAGRKLLDAAEHLLEDPKVASSVGAGFAGLAKLAAEVFDVANLADVGRRATGAAHPEPSDPDDAETDPRPSRVTKIPVD